MVVDTSVVLVVDILVMIDSNRMSMGPYLRYFDVRIVSNMIYMIYHFSFYNLYYYTWDNRNLMDRPMVYEDQMI